MRRLLFSYNKFDSIICLKGDLPSEEIFDFLQNIELIAADGAANKLIEIGKKPDLIIGDLDSFDIEENSDLFSKSKIMKIEDQESNDFEKILNFCLNYERHNLLILGMNGGDLEHTLNNQSIIQRYSELLNLCVFDGNRYGLMIFENIRFDCKTGEIISIIPMNYAKISSKNLKWELDNFELTYGHNEGARNHSVADNVEISLQNGKYMLFFDSRLPYCPNFS